MVKFRWAIVILGVVAAGCGNGNGEAQSANGGTSAFCEAKADVDAVSPDTPDEAALRRFQKAARPRLEAMAAAAPEELAAPIEVVTDAYLSASTLDAVTVAVTSPAFAAANDDIATFVHESCDFPEAVFSAVDDEYAEAPESVPAGQTYLFLRNTGKNLHAIVLFRLNDGVELTAQQLATDGTFEKEGTFVTALLGPASSDAGVVTDLTPGRYFYFDDEHLDKMFGILTVE